MKLSEDEHVVRAALYPRMGVTNEYVVAIESVIKFGTYMKCGSEYLRNSHGKKYGEISVGRLEMLPTLAAIHEYGCRTALISNNAKRIRVSEAGQEWSDDRHRDYYVGSYRLSVLRIVAIRSLYHSLEVHYHPIEGLPEHCNIQIVLENEEVPRKEQSHDRTDVIQELCSILEDPQRHVCDYDLDHEELLLKVSLEVPVARSSNVVALAPPAQSPD